MRQKLKSKADGATTVLGIMLGGLVAVNIDYGKLLAGDKTEIGKAVGAVVVALYGYLTNKK